VYDEICDLADDVHPQCVALKPDWGKGYSRLGAAFFGLGEFLEAAEAYEQGLQHDPSSDLLKSGLSGNQAMKGF